MSDSNEPADAARGEQRKPRNQYTAILGYFALVCLILTGGSLILQSMYPDEDAWGQPEPMSMPPIGYAGLALGVLWLVVKAVLSRREN